MEFHMIWNVTWALQLFCLITSAAQLIMIAWCNYLAEGAGGMRPIVAPVCSPGMKMDGLMICDNQAGVRRHSSGPSVSTQRRRSLTADSVLARRLVFTNPVIKASAGVENGLVANQTAACRNHQPGPVSQSGQKLLVWNKWRFQCLAKLHSREYIHRRPGTLRRPQEIFKISKYQNVPSGLKGGVNLKMNWINWLWIWPLLICCQIRVILW